MLSLLIPSSNSHIPLQASIDSVNLTSIILEHHVIMIFLLALVMKTTVTHQLKLPTLQIVEKLHCS
jgi:hypothetical protein